MKNVFFLWLKIYFAWKYLHPRNVRGNIIQYATFFTALPKFGLVFGKIYTFPELFYSLSKSEAKCIYLLPITISEKFSWQNVRENESFIGHGNSWQLPQKDFCGNCQVFFLAIARVVANAIVFFSQISQILFPWLSQFTVFFLIFKLSL